MADTAAYDTLRTVALEQYRNAELEGFAATLAFVQGRISALEMVSRMQDAEQARFAADRAAMEAAWDMQDAELAEMAEQRKQREGKP
ncbi:MAG: hypothetical protein ACLP1E_08710 [Acidimicrobiales bacterium]